MQPPQLQAKPFFSAATKIRIGRGRSLPSRQLQAKLFFFAATKIRIGRRRSLPLRPQQAKLFFFAATKIRIGRRRSLPLRTHQAKPFSPASIRKSGPEIKNRCTQEGVNGEKLTSIRKFGPEIKNHCSRGAVSWRNLAVILKLTPSNQESLQLWDCFWAIPCSDSQIDPMKSRITAAFGLFPRKSMHRFPSLGLKSRITACSRPSSARVH